MSTRVPVLAAALLLSAASAGAAGDGGRSEPFSIRGHQLKLHLYGARGAPVAVVSSGDGGWVHLAPTVAQYLASRGFFVVGFDSKAYLSSFTSGSRTLTVAEVPGDFAALVDYAGQGAPGSPLLMGVSEGAGLSVLAATAKEVQSRIAGVVALGLPEKNELGWRFRDSMIYVTKKVPNEPLFSVSEQVSRVAPVPLAVLRSTHDEFVTAADTEKILAAAREPRRLWTIDAADHRFSDRQDELQRALLEAIAWIARQRAGSR
ncbi:MAG TPA: AcvB/VirJ family lysyl-phosphatidylglycerol hydrolase [Vicinamibacteria bacterium]|nr:AcvB/VirJ family lysyl-phosphatidylglycerol hydrolase [Vicinamibacteria bacterium]